MDQPNPELDGAGHRPPPRFRARLPGVVGIGLAALVVSLALVAALGPAFFPAAAPLAEDARRAATLAIFAASYLALALGKIPGLNIDRAGVALVGAGLMVAAGALPLEEAYRAIDLDTITLLLGMMIVVGSLRLSGFFTLATIWIARRVKTPGVLLCAVVAASGLFSAFLVNDAICLVLAPLVLDLALALGRKPVPYLLAVAMASNIGSVATLTGNPQNILIGGITRISYTDFAASLYPAALAGLVVTVVLIRLLHREEFSTRLRAGPVLPRARANRVLIGRALASVSVMVALFFAGKPPAKAAIIIGGLLLLTRRVKSQRIYAEVDWSLLLMFAGLFVIVAGAQRVLFTPSLARQIGALQLGHTQALACVTAVLSNLVSNVPAVLMMKPMVAALPDQTKVWRTIAMASTFAGNTTLLASMANLIVAQKAARRGVAISFRDYFVTGAPLTLLTLAIGTLWLAR